MAKCRWRAQKSRPRAPSRSLVELESRPEGEPELHLDAMETVFGRLSDDGFRRFLRQADSVGDVMTLISESDAASSG